MSTPIKQIENKIQTLASEERVLGLESRVNKLERFCDFETFTNKVKNIIFSTLKTDDFRNKARDVMQDYMKNESMMNVCMKYAGKEIDRRKIKNTDKVSVIVITSAITVILNLIITYLLKKFI